jgi:hypothetical protein
MSDKEEITGGPRKQKMRTMRMANHREMFGNTMSGDLNLSGDEKLRAENPGLQELWDQYQTMLKLLKPANPAPSESEKATNILALIKARAKTNHTPGMHIEADMLSDIRNRLTAGKDDDEPL